MNQEAELPSKPPNSKKKELPDLDYRQLDREFDRVKTEVFLGKRAAFLGPLLCSMNFSWTTDIETACTNGITLWWNPIFFLKTKKKVRPTVLLHELWHPGLLHMLRRGDRDPLIWNYAGDITINNMLDHEGYSFEGFKPWMDHKYNGWATEDIYDDLMKKREEELEKAFSKYLWGYQNDITGKGDTGDIVEPANEEERKQEEHTILNNVISASHSANMSGAGSMPGEVETILKRFLSPKLPWDRILNQFFNELANLDYTWNRPNRRYQDIYLPSLQDDRQGLEHILYFEDVSGSISDGDAIRFNSEFKHVKDYYQPEKMTMAQFDTIIQKVDVFHKDDPFEEVLIVGRGGTSLVCVRDMIIKENPTAVVIFSDLQCDPMEPLPAGMNIPIIWIALNNKDATVPHGQIVHLRE